LGLAALSLSAAGAPPSDRRQGPGSASAGPGFFHARQIRGDRLGKPILFPAERTVQDSPDLIQIVPKFGPQAQQQATSPAVDFDLFVGRQVLEAGQRFRRRLHVRLAAVDNTKPITLGHQHLT
jgi:hypothetical protein